MHIYDRKGMLIIPNALEKVAEKSRETVIVKQCFCHNGHSLMNKRAMFNCSEGIFLKAKNDGNEGFIALSPVYGEMSRISLDMDLICGETYQLLCPTCNESLPVFSTCGCGGEIIALFLNNKGDFLDSIALCNRVSCNNSAVKSDEEALSMTMVNSSKKKSGLDIAWRHI